VNRLREATLPKPMDNALKSTRNCQVGKTESIVSPDVV